MFNNEQKNLKRPRTNIHCIHPSSKPLPTYNTYDEEAGLTLSAYNLYPVIIHHP